MTMQTTWGYPAPFISQDSLVTPVTAPAGPFAHESAHSYRYTLEDAQRLQAEITRPEHAPMAARLFDAARRDGLTGKTLEERQTIHARIDAALGGMIDPGLRDNGQAFDTMVATPTGIGLATTLGEQQFLNASGRSSTNPRDLELLRPRVESQVKLMQSQGASRDDILRAVGNLASTPELAQVAAELAEAQLAPNQFVLLPPVPADPAPASVESAVVGDAVRQAFLVNAQVRQAERQNDWRREQSGRVNPGPVPAMATSFATVDTVGAAPTDQLTIKDALEFVENTGPTRGLPNLKGGAVLSV